MIIPNSFEKGLNRDIAFTREGNNSLYKGLNIELTTNFERGSTLSIANTRGNKLLLTFPNTLNIYKFIPAVGNNTITLAGHSYTFSSTNLRTAHQLLVTEYAAEIAFKQFKIQYNNQYILIISCNLDPTPTAVGGTISTYIPEQSNLTILGYGRINEHLILYTTNKDNISPTGAITIGQIWLVDFNTLNDTIANTTSPNYELSLFDNFIYEEYLDWYLEHAIYNEVVGREENQQTGRNYFTDNYNYVRAINCYNPNLFCVSPDLLDLKPAFTPDIPLIQQISNGGNIPVGSIQFAYYLKTIDGGITNYSPKSNLINLSQSGVQTNYTDYEGSPSGLNSGKSVTVQINNIDTRYDFLVLAVIEYSTQNVPLVYEVAELAINSSTLEYTYSGSEQKVAVQIADLVNPRIQFKTAKTLTYKRNRLYAANTTTPSLFLDWDSRAYRFKKDPLNPSTIYSQVFSQDGSYKYINTNYEIYSENNISVTPYIPSDSEDLVNPYNDESGTVYGTQGSIPDYTIWQTQYQFKYQADGITLGGEGPNIKYRFLPHSQEADGFQAIFPSNPNVGLKNYRTGQLASSFTGPTQTQVNPTIPTFNENYLGIPTQVYNIGYPYTGNKNPYTSSLYIGYSRGEVYRLGIVFVTDKNEEYEAKWIADIKIPEPKDSTNGLFDLSYSANLQSPTNTITIGIEFTIKDTSKLPQDVVGFYFVRLERKEQDKTRLAMGAQFSPLQTGQAKFNFDNGNANNINTFKDSDTPFETILGSADTDTVRINGNNNDCYYLGFKLPTRAFNTTFDSYTGANYGACASSWLMVQNFWTGSLSGNSNPKLFTVKSPEHDFGKYNFDATHLKFVHFYQSTETNYFDPELTGVDFGDLDNKPNCRVDAWWVKFKKVAYNRDILININKHRTVEIEDIVPASYDSSMKYDYYNIALKPDQQFGELAGGGAKHIFGVTDTNNPYVLNGLPNYLIGQPLHRVVALNKYNFGQYGGPWRINRYANTYIQTNNFQPISTINSSQQTTLVFGGDTFTTFYSTMLYCFPWTEDYGVPERGGVGSGLYPGYAYTDDMKGLAIVFPCETTINTELRYGQYWNKSQVPVFNSTKFALFQFDEFLYNFAYSQQNNIKSFVSRPVNFKPNEEQPNLTWASNNKLDGENVDQWRIFPINQYLPAEGVYGPINRIINFKDNIFVYQQRAISILNTQQVSSVPNSTGQAFTVGLGDLLAFYDYTNGSVKTGTQHQFSVFLGSDTIFHWDERLQKLFMYNGGPQPFSDIKGLSGFIRSISTGINADLPLLRKSIHGGYDTKYNKAYFTFQNELILRCNPYSGNTYEIATPDFSILQNILQEGDELSLVPFSNIFPDNTTGVVSIDLDNQKVYITLRNIIGQLSTFRTKAYFETTLSYNKLLDTFESEHSFKPKMYITTDDYMVTPSIYQEDTLWIHNKGLYGNFYGRQYPWLAEFIVTTTDDTNNETARVNYVEFWSQVLDLNNKSVDVSPIDSIRFINDYQDTVNSLSSLTLNQNIKKFERTFRVNYIFDYLYNTPVRAYLRDKYVRIQLLNNNINNYKYILNSWGTDVTKSFH